MQFYPMKYFQNIGEQDHCMVIRVTRPPWDKTIAGRAIKLLHTVKQEHRTGCQRDAINLAEQAYALAA
jgi:hypothetical protein